LISLEKTKNKTGLQVPLSANMQSKIQIWIPNLGEIDLIFGTNLVHESGDRAGFFCWKNSRHSHKGMSGNLSSAYSNSVQTVMCCSLPRQMPKAQPTAWLSLSPESPMAMKAWHIHRLYTAQIHLIQLVLVG
jgi:hypothetical protein